MTLLGFVKAECANYKHGQCIWGECSVASGCRCNVSRDVLFGGDPSVAGPDYFSACVVPLAKDFPEYSDAAIEYARICGHRQRAVNQTRLCGCGEFLAKRSRFCPKCAKTKRLEAWRKSKAVLPQLTPKTDLQPLIV